MTDDEIDCMIREIDQMARRIGCRFVPDAKMLDAFRESQYRRRKHIEEYRAAVDRL
jgi:ferredoxin-thioredoxin reductase catalytic subunit